MSDITYVIEKLSLGTFNNFEHALESNPLATLVLGDLLVKSEQFKQDVGAA